MDKTIFITPLPAFYKVNLYNEIAKKKDISAWFLGNGTIENRSSDFVSTEMNFDHCFINKGSFQSRNKLISLVYGVPELNISTKYFESILINFIWTCTLSFLLFILFSKLKFNIKALEYLGINSLLIFLIHPYTNNIAYYAASNYLIQLFISLSMLVLITYFLNNFKKYLKNG